MKTDEKSRCSWCGDDPLYVVYHDTEWGVPVHDDRKMFEMLLLETFQAGLSWITVLKKRERFRVRFKQFDPVQVAQMTDRELQELLSDKGIIRNRQKIFAARKNAQAFLETAQEFGSFCSYLWTFVGHRPIVNRWSEINELPSRSALSEVISKDLKRRGFQFVGPTIVYAHLQAAGLVNDHLISCFRHGELSP
ncbi:MAG: DNA-3-methyladenine glycosylase 1 [Flavobacteriia bacterium]|nr:MAG: DNA-3-methyladenine glycosylase 1 [Flavobacteriia bacterium]